jgi:iron complex outermembrane recepter protein
MSGSIDRSSIVSLKCCVALMPLVAGLISTSAYAQATPAQEVQQEIEAEVAIDRDTKVIGAKDEDGDEADEQEDKKTIVVTGTSIRGAPPTGTNLISVDEEGIKATGANSASELLQNIPQAGGGYFNDLGQRDPGGLETQSGTVEKPNLRATPSSSTDSGSSTLVLLDGKRTAGTGIIHNATDVNAMPVALLERVEVNTDGGSSIYGSDGIGGVINFITRRKFDGIQVRGRYGIADDYYNYEWGGIVGHTIGPVSAFVSFSQTGNDGILNGERSFYNPIDFNTGLPTSLQCEPANVAVGTRVYGVDANGNVSSVPGLINAPVSAGGITSPNLCTPGLEASFTGENKRNNALASVAVDFSDAIKFTVRGRYADSRSRTVQAPFNTTVTIAAPTATNPGNPFRRALPAPDATAAQRVSFSFAPAFDAGLIDRDRLDEITAFEQYGISPELSVNIGPSWQVRAFVNWEKSHTKNNNFVLDSTALNTAAAAPTLASALNPYNIEQTAAAVLDSVTDQFEVRESYNQILNSRITADGVLFDLPGGTVRAAIGAEYLKDKFRRRNYNGPPAGFGSGAFTGTSRDVKSAFAELNIPFVSNANAMPLIQELRLALSGRYDKYSDFGDSFSPRIGATYSPVDWLRFRGNWGKSFRAPTVVESLNSLSNNASIQPLSSPFLAFLINRRADRPAEAVIPSATELANFVGITNFGGTAQGLKAQTGTNWSAAAEFRPTNNFRAEVSYYNIDYRNSIGFPNAVGLFPTFEDFVNYYPTDAEIRAYLAEHINGDQIYAQLAGRTVYALYDLRTTNLGNAKIEGLDFSARFDFDTPVGSAFLSANGNVQLTNDVQTVRTLPFTDAIEFGTSRSRFSVVAGVRNGGFRSQVTLNHSAGFRLNPANNPAQRKVGSYDLVNAFFGYEFGDGEEGGFDLLDGLELTLTIQNLFDNDPPEFRGQNGYLNGSTLGRLVQFGVTKNFF